MHTCPTPVTFDPPANTAQRLWQLVDIISPRWGRSSCVTRHLDHLARNRLELLANLYQQSYQKQHQALIA